MGDVESLGIGEPISIRGIVNFHMQIVPRNNWMIQIHGMNNPMIDVCGRTRSIQPAMGCLNVMSVSTSFHATVDCIAMIHKSVM